MKDVVTFRNLISEKQQSPISGGAENKPTSRQNTTQNLQRRVRMR